MQASGLDPASLINWWWQKVTSNLSMSISHVSLTMTVTVTVYWQW